MSCSKLVSTIRSTVLSLPLQQGIPALMHKISPPNWLEPGNTKGGSIPVPLTSC